MTPERAREILRTRNGLYAHVMTPAERKFVEDVWSRMPGYTCMHDAVCAIANNDVRVLERGAKYPALTHVRWNGCEGVVVDFEKGENGQLVYLIRLENGNPVWTDNEESLEALP